MAYWAPILLKALGVLVQCYPLEAFVSRNFIRNGLSSCKQLLLRFVAIALESAAVAAVLVIILKNYAGGLHRRQQDDPRLSAEIELILFLGGSVSSFSIIRVSSTLKRTQIDSCFASLRSCWAKRSSRRSPRCQHVGLYIATACLTAHYVGTSIAILLASLDRNTLEACEDGTFSCNSVDTPGPLQDYIFVIMMMTSLYACNFLVWGALVLAQRMEEFSAACGMLTETESAFETEENDLAGRADRVIGRLTEEFTAIKEDFELYGEVGGRYALGLVAELTLGTIAVLSGVIDATKNWAAWVDYPLGFCSFLCVPSLFAVIYVGDYVTRLVRAHYDRLHDLEGELLCIKHKQSIQFLRWLKQWRWRFMAGGLFRVKVGLLTGIAATVMSYFIFLFQLKQSEGGMQSISLEAP